MATPSSKKSLYGFNTPASRETDQPSHAEVWQGLKENTTAHGIPHINNAKGVIKKTLWSVISIAVLGAMVFHLYSLFNNYFQYKVSVHIDIVSNKRMVFPAVTLCNINPIKNSLLSTSEALSFLRSDNGETRRRRRKRQTSGSMATYSRVAMEESYVYNLLTTYSDTTTDLGSNRDRIKQIVISGESAWILDAWNTDSQFFCPGTHTYSTSAYTVLEANADAAYKISHACGLPTPATGAIDVISDGNTCDRDYTVSCDASTPFTDGQLTKTLTCTAGFSDYGGAMDMSQISDCFDAVILYGNSDKTGANYIVTSDSSVDFHWQNRISAVTITGPNHWVLYTDSAYSTSQDYYSFCPGDYQATTHFTDNAISSMARATGPLCATVSTYSHTQYSVDNTTSCWTVTYTCQPGYSFSDGSISNSVSCTGGQNTTTGVWSGKVPTCEVQTTTLDALSTAADTTTMVETTMEVETTTIQDTTTVEDALTTLSESVDDVTTTGSNTDAATATSTTPNALSTAAAAPDTTIPDTTTVEDVFTTLTDKTTPASNTDAATSTFPPELGEPKREDFLLQESVIETLADLPMTEKVSLGYQSTDMLLDCAYEGRNCDIAKDFSHFHNPVLGNCYIYNSGWDGKDYIYSHRTGQRYGLSVVINIDQSEYTDKLTGPAGARIVIHDQSVMPFPTDLGILARPGELLSVGVKRVNFFRKPHPYGNCTDEYNNELSDMYVGLHGVEYSEMGCIKTCYQREVVKKCGCGDPSYPLYATALGEEIVRSCSSQDLKEVACQFELENEFAVGEISCDCHERCSESYYITDISTAQWPASKHQSDLLEELSSNNPDFNVSSNFSMYDNLLKVEVYFHEFNLEDIIEKPTYMLSQLMSDLGGAFGLWFGLSILSFFEFFEFFMDMSVLACLRCCKKKTAAANGPSKKEFRKPHAQQSQLKQVKQSYDSTSPPPPYGDITGRRGSRMKQSPDPTPGSSNVSGRPRYHDYLSPVDT